MTPISRTNVPLFFAAEWQARNPISVRANSQQQSARHCIGMPLSVFVIDGFVWYGWITARAPHSNKSFLKLSITVHRRAVTAAAAAAAGATILFGVVVIYQHRSSNISREPPSPP